MTSTEGPKILVAATFVTLSVGFVAGYWLGAQSDEGPAETATSGEPAPHAVGAQEYVQLGISAFSSGRVEEAERLFRRALAQAPNDPNVRTDLAVVLISQERWDEAEEQIEAARETAPEMPEVYLFQGIIDRDARGDTTAAREAWSRFLDLVPEESPQAETVRGWLAELEDGSSSTE